MEQYFPFGRALRYLPWGCARTRARSPTRSLCACASPQLRALLREGEDGRGTADPYITDEKGLKEEYNGWGFYIRRVVDKKVVVYDWFVSHLHYLFALHVVASPKFHAAAAAAFAAVAGCDHRPAPMKTSARCSAKCMDPDEYGKLAAPQSQHLKDILETNDSMIKRHCEEFADTVAQALSSLGDKEALTEAAHQEITAKAVTPFLLSRVFDMTQGRSLTANIALVLNNARLAAQIAQNL